MRRLILFGYVSIATCFGQLNLRPAGTTATSISFAYDSPDFLLCTIQVSTDPAFATVVPDVDATLFTGRNVDLNRSDTVISGRSRIVTVGRREPATSILVTQWVYGLALQADSLYSAKMTCTATNQTIKLRTRNIPLGSTYTPVPFVDPAIPGSYLYPSRNHGLGTAGTRNGAANSYIDPWTGAAKKQITFARDYQVSGQTVASYVNGTAITDPTGMWTNPDGFRTQATVAAFQGTSCVRTPCQWLAVPFTFLGGTFSPDGVSGYAAMDYMQANIKCSGTDAIAANRTIEACLSDDITSFHCASDIQALACTQTDPPPSFASIGTTSGIDLWTALGKPQPMLLLGNNPKSGILYRKQTNTGTTKLYQYNLNAHFSQMGETTLGGGNTQVANSLCSNGFLHMTGYSPPNYDSYYDFDPATGTTHWLGFINGVANSGNVSFDASDPHTLYQIVNDNLLQLDFAGTDTADVAQGNTAASFTPTTLIAGFKAAVLAFDATFDTSTMACNLGAQQTSGTDLYVICRRGASGGAAWLVVVDLTGPSISAAMPQYKGFASRWCGSTGSTNNGGQNLFESTGIALAAPYNTTLGTAMNAAVSGTTQVISVSSACSGTCGSWANGDPVSNGSASQSLWLQATQVGDVVSHGGELMKITARSSATSFTVQRGWGNTTGVSHAVGSALTMQCTGNAGATGSMSVLPNPGFSATRVPNATTAYWKYLSDVHGTDSTNVNVVTGFAMGPDAQRGNLRMFTEDFVPFGSSGTLAFDNPGQPPTLTVDSNTYFNGWRASTAGLQKHVGYQQSTPASELQWVADSRPVVGDPTWLGNAGQSGSMALVTGNLYTYKVNTPMSVPFNYKSSPILSFCGYAPLTDVSSPNLGNVINDSNPYTYCVANATDECRTGSVKGDVYISCPGRTVLACGT